MHCNGIVDCSDNSDEIACDQLEFNKYYDIEQVPRMKDGEILIHLLEFFQLYMFTYTYPIFTFRCPF